MFLTETNDLCVALPVNITARSVANAGVGWVGVGVGGGEEGAETTDRKSALLTMRMDSVQHRKN